MPQSASYVINIVGGPGIGKSLTSGFLFSKLKLKGESCEFVQEVAKDYVWQQRYEILDNQYHLSLSMYEKLKSIYGKVKYVITDGSLLHGLYYNKYNTNNVSNVEKTQDMILSKFKEFNNVVLFIARGDHEYEQEGRIQNFNEALHVDEELKKILVENKIEYYEIQSGENVDNIIEILNVNFS